MRKKPPFTLKFMIGLELMDICVCDYSCFQQYYTHHNRLVGNTGLHPSIFPSIPLSYVDN